MHQECEFSASDIDSASFDTSSWQVMKSLIEAQEQSMKALEQYAMAQSVQDVQLDDQEFTMCLKQARQCHERAIEDLEHALSVVETESSDGPSEPNSSIN